MPACSLWAQDTAILKALKGHPEAYAAKINAKIEAFEAKAQKQVDKSLNKLYAIEKKIYKKLLKTDSALAQTMFAGLDEQYQKAFTLLDGRKNPLDELLPRKYSSYVDTLKNTLNFFRQVGSNGSQVMSAVDNFGQLEGHLADLEKLKYFFRQRRALLNMNLSRYKNLGKHLASVNKEVFYYQKIIADFKATLKDPARVEAHAISLLRKIPLFEKFFNEQAAVNSGMAGGSGGTAAVAPNLPAGMQARSAVMGVLQERLSAGNVTPEQALRRQLQSGPANGGRVAPGLQEMGEDFDDMQLPAFKVNRQKGKKFWERLEYGTTLQFGKPNNLLPNTSDLGLTVGYKLSDDGVIGVGAAYKLGLGNGWNDIRFSHQGVGLRSYIDWKLKGIFYISGGYEKNYHAQFAGLEHLQNFSAWQASGMIGLKTQYQMSRRVKANAQLLFDFLYKQHIPNTQPLVFRVGWGL